MIKEVNDAEWLMDHLLLNSFDEAVTTDNNVIEYGDQVFPIETFIFIAGKLETHYDSEVQQAMQYVCDCIAEALSLGANIYVKRSAPTIKLSVNKDGGLQMRVQFRGAFLKYDSNTDETTAVTITDEYR